MNRKKFGRRGVLIITALLELPWLAGMLFAHDLIPEFFFKIVKFGMLPVWILVHELQTSVVWGGVDGLKELLFRGYRPNGPAISFVLDVIIITAVSYLVAFVGVHVGNVLAFVIDAIPDNLLLKSVLGTVATVGVISFVSYTIKLLTASPLQHQIFHPQGVAGVLTLAVLVMVVFWQRTIVP